MAFIPGVIILNHLWIFSITGSYECEGNKLLDNYSAELLQEHR